MNSKLKVSARTHTQNQFLFHGKLNGTSLLLHQKLSICLEPTGINSYCFQDRVKAFNEISYPSEVDKKQNRISVFAEDHIFILN